MKGTEKNLAGPAIVLGIILLATLGAALTWQSYSADHPNAVWAELLDEKTVSAEFAPDKTPLIREGAKAIVSANGVRSTGYVTWLTQTGNTTRFQFLLLEPFVRTPAGTPCQVTVDLSLPPELLKDSP
jgi:hypothetical protein